MIRSRFLPGAAALIALALTSGTAAREAVEPALPTEVHQTAIDRREDAQMSPWAVSKRRPAQTAWIFHGMYRLHHEAEQAARNLRQEGWEAKVMPHHHLREAR